MGTDLNSDMICVASSIESSQKYFQNSNQAPSSEYLPYERDYRAVIQPLSVMHFIKKFLNI